MSRKRTPDEKSTETSTTETSTAVAEPPAAETSGNGQSFADRVGKKKRVTVADPFGIAFASVLWAFLDVQSNALQIQAGVAQELVNIIQGVILFAVVIAYELIRRADRRLEQTRVARELAAQRRAGAATQGAPA